MKAVSLFCPHGKTPERRLTIVARRLCIWHRVELEATRALKPQPRMLLPPGEHSGVYGSRSISFNGEEVWMMRNARKNPNRQQKLVTSFLGPDAKPFQGSSSK